MEMQAIFAAIVTVSAVVYAAKERDISGLWLGAVVALLAIDLKTGFLGMPDQWGAAVYGAAAFFAVVMLVFRKRILS